MNRSKRIILYVSAMFFAASIGVCIGAYISRPPVSIADMRSDPEYHSRIYVGNSLCDANSEPASADTVNINSADINELCRLDGIGDTLAKNIIAYRDANGPFTTAEELLFVSGIGESKLEAMRSQIAFK